MKPAELLKDLISSVYYAGFGIFHRNDDLVVVYHSVSQMNPENDIFKMNVSTDLFKLQIGHLAGLQAGRNVTLTFDDGFESFYEVAFPIAAKSGIKTILFITTGFIGQKVSFNYLFRNKQILKPLSWSQVKEISDAGIEIGSHAVTHATLSEIDEKSAEREIADSKKIIEDHIGKPVKCFAYPTGSRHTVTPRLKELIQKSGYTEAYTNIMGFNNSESDVYALRRMRIYNTDTMPRFKMKVKGAYDWVDYAHY